LTLVNISSADCVKVFGLKPEARRDRSRKNMADSKPGLNFILRSP